MDIAEKGEDGRHREHLRKGIEDEKNQQYGGFAPEFHRREGIGGESGGNHRDEDGRKRKDERIREPRAKIELGEDVDVIVEGEVGDGEDAAG